MLRLLYFRGCPNIEKAKDLLRGLDLAFEEVCQDDLPSNDPLRGYTSPTILDGEKIVIGAKTGGDSGGCSLDFPSLHEFKQRLQCIRSGL